MIRVIKGDISIICDTQAELKIALAALLDTDEPPLPAWRVGGPTDGGLTSEQWEHGR